MIDYVRDFHVKFGLPDGSADAILATPGAYEFRKKFMQEELDEFDEAMRNGDRVKAFDALLDLAYVVYGTALFMGIPPSVWKEGMLAVHECNMAKVRVDRAENSKRGSAFDVVKPAGWTGPEAKLRRLLTCA